MDDGQQECSRFAGAGLGRSNYIFACKYKGYYLLLHGCGRSITHGINAFLQTGVEVEICKIHVNEISVE